MPNISATSCYIRVYSCFCSPSIYAGGDRRFRTDDPYRLQRVVHNLTADEATEITPYEDGLPRHKNLRYCYLLLLSAIEEYTFTPVAYARTRNDTHLHLPMTFQRDMKRL